MGPLINPGKVCLSKVWSLQTFLQKRQIQTRFDYKEKGNYRPLANRKDIDKPRDWSTLQKQWLHVNWDNDILRLDFNALQQEEKNSIRPSG